jgi:hypothetical protein
MSGEETFVKRAGLFSALFLLINLQWSVAQEAETKIRSIVFANGVTLRAGECSVPNTKSELKFCMPKEGATKAGTSNGYQLRGLSCQEKGKDFRPCSIQQFDAGPGEKAPSCQLQLLGFGMTFSRFECPKQTQ